MSDNFKDCEGYEGCKDYGDYEDCEDCEDCKDCEDYKDYEDYEDCSFGNFNDLDLQISEEHLSQDDFLIVESKTDEINNSNKSESEIEKLIKNIKILIEKSYKLKILIYDYCVKQDNKNIEFCNKINSIISQLKNGKINELKINNQKINEERAKRNLFVNFKKSIEINLLDFNQLEITKQKEMSDVFINLKRSEVEGLKLYKSHLINLIDKSEQIELEILNLRSCDRLLCQLKTAIDRRRNKLFHYLETSNFITFFEKFEIINKLHLVEHLKEFKESGYNELLKLNLFEELNILQNEQTKQLETIKKLNYAKSQIFSQLKKFFKKILQQQINKSKYTIESSINLEYSNIDKKLHYFNEKCTENNCDNNAIKLYQQKYYKFQNQIVHLKHNLRLEYAKINQIQNNSINQVDNNTISYDDDIDYSIFGNGFFDDHPNSNETQSDSNSNANSNGNSNENSNGNSNETQLDSNELNVFNKKRKRDDDTNFENHPNAKCSTMSTTFIIEPTTSSTTLSTENELEIFSLDSLDKSYTQSKLYSLANLCVKRNMNLFKQTEKFACVEYSVTNKHFLIPRKYLISVNFSDYMIDANKNDNFVNKVIKYIEALIYWQINHFPDDCIEFIQAHLYLFTQHSLTIQSQYQTQTKLICEYEKKKIEIIEFIKNFSQGHYEFKTNVIELFMNSIVFNRQNLISCYKYNIF